MLDQEQNSLVKQEFWRTDKGIGNQSGSKFVNTNWQDITYPWTTTSFPQRVTADFNCKIYDDDGRSKQITNGWHAYHFAKDFEQYQTLLRNN